jgi:predicted lipoprotein with Yx(FWY)xxD motif
MRRSRPIAFLASVALTPLAAVAFAACGGGAAAAPSPSKSTTAPAESATVRVANSRLARVLVNSTGQALYLFKAEVATKSACSGACATAWPPLLANGEPTAGTGLTAAKLRTITRSDGTQKVTYNGRPPYVFIKDPKPGDVNGQGVTAFGAGWDALTSAGNQISAHQPSSGGGYGY